MRVGAAGSAVGFEIYEDAQVRVVSDKRVPRAEGRALASRISRAYKWDERKEKWRDPAPLRPQVTVEVLSTAAFNRFTGDSTGSIAGVTTGPNVFVMPERALHDVSSVDENTIAHELAHVQDLREAGRAIEKVPIYLQEGKAYVLGDQYPASLGLHDRHLAEVSRTLGQLTAHDAQTVLDHFRVASDEQRNPQFTYYGEITGALFVEWLRTRKTRDAVPRLAQAIADTGQGASFESAFHAQFGISVAGAESAFVRFIAATEGDPRERLKGTIYGAGG
jgi:hypothetical protein